MVWWALNPRLSKSIAAAQPPGAAAASKTSWPAKPVIHLTPRDCQPSLEFRRWKLMKRRAQVEGAGVAAAAPALLLTLM
jgi:hypothetical protein